MRRGLLIGLAVGGALLALIAVWSGDPRAAVPEWMLGGSQDPSDPYQDLQTSAAGGRTALPGARAVPVALPEGRSVPRDEKELAEFVAWMRGLGHDELLHLSNAEFDFTKSELIERLQRLEGPWVVAALGGLAIAEEDPLLKAILVEGLVGGVSLERLDDEHLLPVLDSLMTQMSGSAQDPHEVAGGLASYAYMACARGGGDYALLVGPHLAGSDNAGLLGLGYLFMGKTQGSESVLKEMLTAHQDPSGRFGALEGLRQSATDGRIAPAEITALGLQALGTETNERNRLLLYEMMISTGGEEALTAVEQMLRSGQVGELDKTVELLALEMEPARAQALFQDLLREHEFQGQAKQALYNAMGLAQGEEGVDFLLGVARNGKLDEAERLAGLRGLWNRPVDERLAGELRDVFDTSADPALRTEALRMLAQGESAGAGLDLRAAATLDADARVRAEAVQLAAMQPADDTREWLEQRLHEDASLDVKAAALGALVFQAHYTGDGDAVLGYLSRARKFTSDEEALAMIAEGERMVREHDPRKLELGLAAEAEFWGTVAKYADGPAARSFQRQARQLDQIVMALRTTRDGRRSAR